MAKTRYEYDSQNEVDLSLTKAEYFRGWDRENGERMYVDQDILHKRFNSYDSNDKYVFVIDVQSSIDHKSMFSTSWRTGLKTYSYNILSDAGYIPHFAYQSLVRFPDKDGGTSYTWMNKYLADKKHMQFELLGLDDKGVQDVYNVMQRMVVDDLTDECKTLLCPARFMDDIYRIWCETTTVRVHPELYPHDMYFSNEYKEYQNPELEFAEDDTVEYTFDDDFELDLPIELGNYANEDPTIQQFKELLDEYYI